MAFDPRKRGPLAVGIAAAAAAILLAASIYADAGGRTARSPETGPQAAAVAAEDSAEAVPDGGAELVIPSEDGHASGGRVIQIDGPELLEKLETAESVEFLGDYILACQADGKTYACAVPDGRLRAYAESVASGAGGSEHGADGTPEAVPDDDDDGFGSFLLDMMMGFLIVGSAACILARATRVRSDKDRDKDRSVTVMPQSTPQPQAGHVRQERDKPDGIAIPRVRFGDVEGVQGLKDDVMRLVDCLKYPDKYRALGARMPKGVILYGPPGTGKTLLAKAIAGEAGVPFLFQCGSDFVEKYVGVGAKRVRELYAKARRMAPCIVFIDEVDAIAAQRGIGDNSERDQAVNALLAELDGFESGDGVITICATNRLEMLDDAFKRAGRFDLKLAVGLPDLEAREHILEIHSRNKPLSDDVSLKQLAKRCVGFSGADLEAMLNEAALTAAAAGLGAVRAADIDEAFFKIVMQGNRKPLKSHEETTRIIAWHEAGHALAIKLLTKDSVPSVTIIGSSSGAGGVTFRSPDEGVLKSKKYLRDTICTMYAGRAAEEIYLGDADLVTTGAQQDIRQATQLIRDYIGGYGMGSRGMLDVSQFQKENGNMLKEASAMADACYKSVLGVLRANRDKLEDMAEALLDKETLDETEIDAIVSGESRACAGMAG